MRCASASHTGVTRLGKAGNHFVSADAAEAAWWLGFLTRDDNLRALRALRILVEAVE